VTATLHRDATASGRLDATEETSDVDDASVTLTIIAGVSQVRE
jgi:hypothetical protein